MSRNPIPASALLAVLAGAACADVPRVAVDIAPVHSLVARVMNGLGAPALIVAPGASPHEYSLRPSEAAALQDAELVFRSSPSLTPWMDGALATLSGEATVVDLIEAEGTLELRTREGALFEAHAHGHEAHEAGHADHGHDDRGDDAGLDEHAAHAQDDVGHDHHAHGHHGDHAHGDRDERDHAEVGAAGAARDHHAHGDHDHQAAGHETAGHDHGARDPHAWLSPDNAAVWLNAIAGRLSAADPDNAGAYSANAAAARDDLAALRDEIEGTLAPVRGRDFVVFHDAYQYFEAAFDLPASGAISVSDATAPSPARIAQIQQRIAAQGIACVLSEPQFDPGIVAAVMEGSAARAAVLDPLGSGLEPGPALYGRMLRNLATALADCL